MFINFVQTLVYCVLAQSPDPVASNQTTADPVQSNQTTANPVQSNQTTADPVASNLTSAAMNKVLYIKGYTGKATLGILKKNIYMINSKKLIANYFT